MVFEIERQIVLEGYDRKTGWFQPRVALIPPNRAVMTLTKSDLTGSDLFLGIHSMHSDDLGRTWTAPVVQESLGREPFGDSFEVVPCDITPVWHAVTGKLLATGHTAVYRPGELHPIVNNDAPMDVVWAVYDDRANSWPRWSRLAKPDEDHFFRMAAGCSDRVDLPDGTLLQPTYSMSRSDVGENSSNSCYFTCVMKCRFDGESLALVDHGNEMTVPDRRGLCEPSLTHWNGTFYLTLRNDVRAYVTTSTDGLHFEPVEPWRFDDGEELGSINTQQHWITRPEGLYLVYTRRGLDNDDIFRWRAPLMIARVDTDRLVVLRETEREVLPRQGATMGNFGTVDVNHEESWVTVAEGMQNGKIGVENLHLAEAAGANNRVYLARLKWDPVP